MEALMCSKTAKFERFLPVLLFVFCSAFSPPRLPLLFLYPSHFLLNLLSPLAQGLKVYSNWPTYPQVFVDTQLIGRGEGRGGRGIRLHFFTLALSCANLAAILIYYIYFVPFIPKAGWTSWRRWTPAASSLRFWAAAEPPPFRCRRIACTVVRSPRSVAAPHARPVRCSILPGV